MLQTLLGGLWLILLSAPALAAELDVVVYGATPAGIAAAIGAAREQCTVRLIEPTGRIGGMVTNGLSHTDLRTFEGLNGSYLEFARRVEQHYREQYGAEAPQVRECWRGIFGEPKVNLLVYQQMLAEYPAIETVLQQRLQHVQVSLPGPTGTYRIESITLKNAAGDEQELTARIFIDATYEGDLLALAGVPWRVGREGRDQFAESLAPEESDGELQAYNFRFIMTKDPENRVTPTAPPGYQREQFVDVLPLLADGRITRVFGYPSKCIFKAQLPVLPNGKYDINDVSRNPVRLSLPGQNLDWPAGDQATRERIFAEHLRDQAGLLYFLQNDPEVPESVRKEAAEWGWCRDEFVDSGHLPQQLYVREARRMVGVYIYTEHDTSPAAEDARSVLHPQAIASGDYGPNCHGTSHRGPRFGGEHTGEFYKAVAPYQIPYGVLLPRDVENLLVCGAVSASHVGFCALRLEPIWASLGQAAGHAAGLARQHETPVQGVAVAELQQRLHQQGAATIYLSDVLPGHPDFAAAQWWGLQGGWHGLEPAPERPGQRGQNIEGQYFEAFPGHAAQLEKELDETTRGRWEQMTRTLGLEPPPATGSTRGEFVRAVWQAQQQRRTPQP